MILGLGIGFVGFLAWLFAVGIVGLAIGLVVLFFVRKSRGEEAPLVTFSVPFFIKTFLYIVLIATIVIVASGVADLVNAAFSPIDDKQFSYAREQRLQPLSLPGLLMGGAQEQPREDLNVRLNQGVSNGVGKLLGGGLVLAVAIGLLRALETSDERRRGFLNRSFWIALLAVFTLIALVSVVSAVSRLLGFYLPDRPEGAAGPGEPLANAIVAVPVWFYTIGRALQRLRAA